jgi:HEAT repeat protein
LTASAIAPPLNRASPATVAGPDAAGGAAAWLKALDDADPGLRVSAAQRLALLDPPGAGPALARALEDPAREVRLAAALALATCGGRAEIPALVVRLGDRDVAVARAARVSLENLVGHDAGAAADNWRAWLARNPWDAWEKTLAQTAASDLPETRSAVIALGHVGGSAARGALRARAQKLAAAQTYPPFEQNNRTDRFTFSADSPLNPRPLQETVRALGRMGAAEDIPFLADLVSTHRTPRDGNLYLVEAALDAITRIGGAAAAEALTKALVSFDEYWKMVGWYGDHPALYACHSSPPHARALLGLDALGAGISDAATAAAAVRSLPTDPDRALFPASDDYEEVVGRLLRRGGREQAWVDACLALLGDPTAPADPVLRDALSHAHTAWAGTPGPAVRAAQVLSALCRDPASAPRVRAAYQRVLGQPEEPVNRPLGNPSSIPSRHWTLFYLARTLGNLRDAGAVPLLTSVLTDERNEARHGRPNPAEPNIHFLHLDYTPCWRAAAAWALGRIGDASAKPALRSVVQNLDNALDTRHCAAVALTALMTEEDRPELARLAAGTPDVSVRNILRRAAERRPAPASPTPRLPTQASLRNAP